MCITLNKNYSPENLVVTVNGVVVEFVDEVKYLGVTQWEILTFSCRNSITFDREV